MKLKYLVGSIAFALTTTASALTLQGGSTGVIDNNFDYLGGVHGTIESSFGFIDIFEFSVTGPGIAVAKMLESDFSGQGMGFHFTTLYLADTSNNPLGGVFPVDTNGADDWLVLANLPSAGTYRVILAGSIDAAPVGAAEVENGFYVGAVATLLNPVPEPSTYGMMMLGLVAGGAMCRRRLKG